MTAAPDALVWCDSHCHLQERYLPEAAQDGETDAAPGAPIRGGGVGHELERAFHVGVRRVVCVGTDPETSAQALALAAAVGRGELGTSVPELWATVGLHPHDASTGTAEIVELVERHRPDPYLVGLGECGLDYHYDHSERPVQQQVFAEQVALAKTSDLTLVIHARDAWDDLFDILSAEGVPQRCVLHCFTGGPVEAKRCLDLGMFISFSGIATFKNAPEVREAAVLCPSDRLLVETDSPFLAPVPYRGKPNEPALVPLVGEVVARVRGEDVAVVAASSYAAAADAFLRDAGRGV